MVRTFLRKHRFLLTALLILAFMAVGYMLSQSKPIQQKTVVELGDITQVELKPVPIKSSADVIPFFKRELIKLPMPMILRLAIQSKPGELIAIDQEEKSIVRYLVNDELFETVIEASGCDRFIESLACNEEWLVWVEDETAVYDTSDKSFQWEMFALNYTTGEQIRIDQSRFKTNRFDVPVFINYTPCGLDVSEANVVVYCRTVPEGDRIASELVIFDLATREMKIMDRTGDVREALIAYCGADGLKVAWSKFHQLQDSYEKRLTQYLYSDLYMHDLQLSETIQLTAGGFYNEPTMFGNKMAAVRIPEKTEEQNACNAEIVLIDLVTYDERVLVDEHSPCYKRREFEMYRTLPGINANYISWYNNMMSNRFIYDYQNNQFIELNEDLNFVGRIDTIIWRMFDDAVLIGIFAEEGEQGLYYLKFDHDIS